MVTLRMIVVREGKGAYVLGNGSAFAVDVAPGPSAPGAVRVVESVVPACPGEAVGAGGEVGDVDGLAGAHAMATVANTTSSMRIAGVALLS